MSTACPLQLTDKRTCFTLIRQVATLAMTVEPLPQHTQLIDTQIGRPIMLPQCLSYCSPCCLSVPLGTLLSLWFIYTLLTLSYTAEVRDCIKTCSLPRSDDNFSWIQWRQIYKVTVITFTVSKVSKSLLILFNKCVLRGWYQGTGWLGESWNHSMAACGRPWLGADSLDESARACPPTTRFYTDR